MPDALAMLPATLRHLGGIDLAILFGSRSRGQATDRSDLDLAVLGAHVDLAALTAQLERALGLRVDVISLADLDIPLLEEIIRDGVCVFEGRPGAEATWRSRALATLDTDLPWYERMVARWLHRVAARGL